MSGELGVKDSDQSSSPLSAVVPNSTCQPHPIPLPLPLPFHFNRKLCTSTATSTCYPQPSTKPSSSVPSAVIRHPPVSSHSADAHSLLHPFLVAQRPFSLELSSGQTNRLTHRQTGEGIPLRKRESSSTSQLTNDPPSSVLVRTVSSSSPPC